MNETIIRGTSCLFTNEYCNVNTTLYSATMKAFIHAEYNVQLTQQYSFRATLSHIFLRRVFQIRT